MQVTLIRTESVSHYEHSVAAELENIDDDKYVKDFMFYEILNLIQLRHKSEETRFSDCKFFVCSPN